MDSNSRYQPNSGLLRFRSAPTSVLANFKGDHSHCQGSEPVFRFFDSGEPHETASPPSLSEFVDSNNRPSSDNSKNKNSNTNHNHSNNSSNNAPNGSLMSPSTLRRVNSEQRYGASVLPSPRYPSQNSSAVVGSVGMDQFKGFEFDSHLLRQNSLRSDNFSNNFSFQNGYDTVKAVGNYGGVNGNNDELSLSMNRMKNQISFTSMLTRTSKMGVDGIGATAPDEGRQGCSNVDAPYYSSGFPFGSWNETSHLSDKLIGSKRQRNSNDELLSDAQNGDLGTQVHTLSHHFSLPRSSSEMFSVENLLQFPDSVPCKIRAKRGFATHPRSIAERVRRTRISERIRKLQELVPNMEKQTSTADMLDLAVDYIKDLQKQFKSLSDKRAKCKCIKMKKSETDQVA